MAEIDTTHQGMEEESFDFKQFIRVCLAHWKWFAVSVTIFAALGVFYLLRTPKQYQRSAILYIKDATPGKSNSALAAVASSYGLGNARNGKLIYNEISILQAPAYVIETEKKLGMDMSYSIRKVLRRQELYGKTLPVSLRFMSLKENETARLKIDLNADGTFTMKKFRRWGTKERKLKDYDTEVKGKLNQVVNTPIGKVLVVPTPYYSTFIDKEEGKTITVNNNLPFELASFILKKKYSVEQEEKMGTVLDLSYKDAIPERATDFINTIVEVYKDRQLKDKDEVIETTIDFLDQRIAEFQKSLTGYENKIADYQSKHYITDDGDMPSLIMGQAVSSTQQITALQTQRVLATYIRSMILKDVHAEQVLPNTGLGNDGIDGQIGSYNSLLTQRKSLIANSSAGNPMVKEIDRQLADMKDIMVKSLDNYVAGIDKRLGLAHEHQDETKEKLAEMPGEALYLKHVGRDMSMAERMYLYLLQKREEQEMSRFNVDKAQLVSPPLGSVRPVSPRSKVILLIFLFLGMAIPAGILFAQMSLNTKVRSRKDLNRLTVPLLGDIPFYGKKQRRLPWQKKAAKEDVRIVVGDGKQDKVNEAYRKLRTQLEKAISSDGKGNVTLLTSFNEGSGKSSITINIAKAIALKQKRVLVIDCDMRKGETSKLAGSPVHGLADYLSGKVTDANTVITKYEGSAYLDILPTGTLPTNPTELLDNENFGQLVEALRKEYDYIFIDTPAVDDVADTEIVAQSTDRTLFVIRVGLYERAKLNDIQKVYNSQKYKNMSLVLNATEDNEV